jgi:hypothetical protein
MTNRTEKTREDKLRAMQKRMVMERPAAITRNPKAGGRGTTKAVETKKDPHS